MTKYDSVPTNKWTNWSIYILKKGSRLFTNLSLSTLFSAIQEYIIEYRIENNKLL